MNESRHMPTIDLGWLKENQEAIAFVNGKIFAILRGEPGEWSVVRAAFVEQQYVYGTKTLYKIKNLELGSSALRGAVEWLSHNRKNMA